MRYDLIPHPDTPCPLVASFEVDVSWNGPDHVMLEFVLRGPDLYSLHVPDPADPRRRDGLWRSTCFEAFVGEPAGPYFEYNWSPSTEWAAYAFTGYREGMAAIADLEPAKPFVLFDGEILELVANIDLRPIRGACAPGTRLGLSAVLEDESGSLSYWALAFPPGAPDFHHPDCFAAELPSPEAP